MSSDSCAYPFSIQGIGHLLQTKTGEEKRSLMPADDLPCFWSTVMDGYSIYTVYKLRVKEEGLENISQGSAAIFWQPYCNNLANKC